MGADRGAAAWVRVRARTHTGSLPRGPRTTTTTDDDDDDGDGYAQSSGWHTRGRDSCVTEGVTEGGTGGTGGRPMEAWRPEGVRPTGALRQSQVEPTKFVHYANETYTCRL